MGREVRTSDASSAGGLACPTPCLLPCLLPSPCPLSKKKLSVADYASKLPGHVGRTQSIFPSSMNEASTSLVSCTHYGDIMFNPAFVDFAGGLGYCHAFFFEGFVDR